MENPALGRWVQRQTMLYNSEMLDVERVRRLDQIGFEWDQRNAQWQANFAELKLYRKRLGNRGVPLNWGENPTLARWVMTQRKLYKSGNLDNTRARLMNELGFEWDPFDAAWDARFGELKLYQKRLGNANVPKKYIENPALGNWVSKQRKPHRSGKLERDRFRLLSKLGFRWGS
jgi:hypothetical protein